MRIRSFKKFSKKIQKIAHRKRIPLRAMFELTYRCNLKCIHCYNTGEQKNSRPEDELKTKEAFEILKQLRGLGTFYLGLTGGEIFLRKDILEIISYARRLGLEVILLTNAYFIDKDIADKLQRLMLNKVDITVHAMDTQVFENITGVRGSFERVFAAINLLHERNIPLGLKSCGMQENKEEIVKVSQFARSLNILYRFDNRLMPRLDKSKEPLEHLISPQENYLLRRACYPEMFTKYDEKGRPRRIPKPRGRSLTKLFNCGAGYTDLAISPYGELKTCILIDYPRYKILEGSLKDGWEQVKVFVDNSRPPLDWDCLKCDLVKYCAWCPGKAYLQEGSLSACEPYSRRQAKLSKQIYEQALIS